MNKKVGATVATLGVASAVLLTGTYAWQSLNQEALNEASAVVNPGGRLHDDFDYNNDIKRIYVENFGDRDIYARIKLTEYMEIGNEAGQNLTEADRNVELITTTANYNDKTTWPIYHYLNEGNETFEYWNFDFGGEAVAYLPTFNMNKDSLKADINGTYGAGYSDYVSYDDRVGEQIEGTEIKDNDTNTIEEENPTEENVTETVANHTVATTKASCVISMEEWNALDEATQGTTECWVYDTDGWAYWSKPIAKGTATGTLINDIDVKNVDDSWFYALNATAQFITADDLGKTDGTGFYDVTKGSVPTDNALQLLNSIGVDTSGEAEETEDPYGFSHLLMGYKQENMQSETFVDKAYAKPGDVIPFSAVAYSNNNETMAMDEANTEWTLTAKEGEIAEGTTLSEEGVLTISSTQAPLSVLEVTISYTDKLNNTYTESHNVLISNEDINLTAVIEEAESYVVGTTYQVTATATTVGGTPVPMEWTYDTFATDMENESLSASISETGEFVAHNAGEFTINVWAEYLPGKYATINVTTVD